MDYNGQFFLMGLNDCRVCCVVLLIFLYSVIWDGCLGIASYTKTCFIIGFTKVFLFFHRLSFVSRWGFPSRSRFNVLRIPGFTTKKPAHPSKQKAINKPLETTKRIEECMKKHQTPLETLMETKENHCKDHEKHFLWRKETKH